MSYGWLTESALLPEEQKDIKVDKNSVNNIIFLIFNLIKYFIKKKTS